MRAPRARGPSRRLCATAHLHTHSRLHLPSLVMGSYDAEIRERGRPDALSPVLRPVVDEADPVNFWDNDNPHVLADHNSLSMSGTLDLSNWKPRSAKQLWLMTFKRILVGLRGGRFLADLEARGRVLEDGRRLVQTKLLRQGQWFGEVEVLMNMRTWQTPGMVFAHLPACTRSCVVVSWLVPFLLHRRPPFHFAFPYPRRGRANNDSSHEGKHHRVCHP